VGEVVVAPDVSRTTYVGKSVSRLEDAPLLRGVGR